MDSQNSSDEIMRYIGLAWHWAWLLAIGLIVGAGASYYFSSRQPAIYQASAKFLVSSNPGEAGSQSYYTYYNDQQTLKTYLQLITAAPVIEQTGERLGWRISAGQISARQVGDTQLIQVTATDTDPQRAAEIANTITEVLYEYNSDMQGARFAASEESLQAQIQQVETQIADLESQMTQSSEDTLQAQQQQVEERITLLQTEVNQLEKEIAALLPPAPPAAQPNSQTGLIPTPRPTATLTPQNQALLSEKQDQLSQSESMLSLYRDIYTNIMVYSETGIDTNSGTRIDQLQNNLALYRQIHSNLLASYENVRLARLSSATNIVQIETAIAPGGPIRPQPTKDAMLGGAVGLLIMGAIVFLIEFLDDTIQNPEEITRQLGLPVLGLIASHDSGEGALITSEQPRSPISESFRSLRTNIQFMNVDRGINSILVTSPSPQDGKSTVAANLAVVFAQSGRKVAVVEGDLRRPKVHRMFKIANRQGISSLFTQRQVVLDGNLQQTPIEDLYAVTSGNLPPNPSELVGSEKMSEILRQVRERADFVIIDSPPLLAVTDAALLASKVDGVVLVVKPGVTKRGAAKQAADALQRVGANVLGVVLNDVELKRSRYKYSYYKGYYYTYDKYYGNGKGE